MKTRVGRSLVSCGMAGIMAASLLAGCGAASGDTSSSEATVNSSVDLSEAETEAKEKYTGDKVDLTFWALSTRQDGITALTDVWNKENPNAQVTVSFYSTDGIKDACKTAAQSGSMPSMWFNWGGSLGQYYVDNGVTYDLTQYAKDNDWDNTFNSGALSLVNLGGQISGYPTSYNVLGMFYRKDIFDKYGIAVPTTFDDFTAACKTLKENGVTPISTAGLKGWHVMRLVEQFIEYTAGAEKHDELQSMSTSWNCDEVIEALKIYQEFCQNGYFPDGFTTANPDDTKMAFGSGTAAMDIQGQWYDGTLNADKIDLSNVSWFPFPNGTGRMSAFVEMTQFSGKLTDDELKAAMAYTDFLNSEAATKAFPNDYNLPIPLKNATLDESAQALQPHVMEMLEKSEEVGTFTITDQAFPSEVADVLFNCQDAIAGGSMQPAEAAEKIETAIESYKAKNK